MRLALFLLLMGCITVFAWTTEELAIYDLVEEIGGSFYDFLGVSKVFASFDANLTTEKWFLSFYRSPIFIFNTDWLRK